MYYNMTHTLFIKCSLVVFLATGVYGNISYSSSNKDKSPSYDYQADATTDSTIKTSSLDERDGSGMQASNDSLPAENEYDGKKMAPIANDDKIEIGGKDVRHDPARSNVEDPLKKNQKLVFDDWQLKKAVEHIAGKYWYVKFIQEVD